jgi:hypothetical protein
MWQDWIAMNLDEVRTRIADHPLRVLAGWYEVQKDLDETALALAVKDLAAAFGATEEELEGWLAYVVRLGLDGCRYGVLTNEGVQMGKLAYRARPNSWHRWCQVRPGAPVFFPATSGIAEVGPNGATYWVDFVAVPAV